MAAIRPPYVKVICPTAKTIPVTLNAGFRMPSWFDLKTIDIGGPEDEEGNYLICNFYLFDFNLILYLFQELNLPQNLFTQ